MAFGSHSGAASSKRFAGEKLGWQFNWGERVVTVVAVSLAVLIVATIAVLMGMT
ncbi:MAG TPA: hypothetical protein VIJ78_06120 [Pseudolabrys sp.]